MLQRYLIDLESILDVRNLTRPFFDVSDFDIGSFEYIVSYIPESVLYSSYQLQ